MKSNKKYTNATFTKRVDHEAGHAPRTRESEPAVCAECRAVLEKDRWARAAKDDVLIYEKSGARTTVCPACRQIKTGEPAGFVYLDGEFLAAHRAEIENLLQNEQARAAADNPLARIMRLETDAGKLVVSTTTEHFAQQLGHALNRAYGGEVRYDFSHENKLARVYWHRD